MDLGLSPRRPYVGLPPQPEECQRGLLPLPALCFAPDVWRSSGTRFPAEFVFAEGLVRGWSVFRDGKGLSPEKRRLGKDLLPLHNFLTGGDSGWRGGSDYPPREQETR